MACQGCKKKRQKLLNERWTLDGKITAALSEAMGAIRDANPALAQRLFVLNGEINAQNAKERAEAQG